MVKRYLNKSGLPLVSRDDGGWVKYTDYTAIAERCERLEAEVIELSWSLWSVMDGMQDHDIHAYTGLVDADCERIAESRRKAQELSLRRQEEESQ